MLNLLLYENSENVGTIFISQKGKISIDRKNYRMKNSDALILEVTELLNELEIQKIDE